MVRLLNFFLLKSALEEEERKNLCRVSNIDDEPFLTSVYHAFIDNDKDDVPVSSPELIFKGSTRSDMGVDKITAHANFTGRFDLAV